MMLHKTQCNYYLLSLLITPVHYREKICQLKVRDVDDSGPHCLPILQ